MKLVGHSVAIILTYSPTDDADQAKNDLFDFQLTTSFEGKKKNLLGDLKARQGWKASGAIVGQYGENTINNNGERLIEFCEQIELKILNGWFKQRTCTNIPSVSFKSIIDYIIVKQTTKASRPNVRAMRGDDEIFCQCLSKFCLNLEDRKPPVYNTTYKALTIIPFAFCTNYD